MTEVSYPVHHPNCVASRLAPNGEICAARGPASGGSTTGLERQSHSPPPPNAPGAGAPPADAPALELSVWECLSMLKTNKVLTKVVIPLSQIPPGPAIGSPPLSIGLPPRGWPAGGHPHGAGGGAGRPVGRGLPKGSSPPRSHGPVGRSFLRTAPAIPWVSVTGVFARSGGHVTSGASVPPPSSPLLWPSVGGGRSRFVAETPY